MLEIGFEVYWCVLDGADWSRQFVKMHFHDKNPDKQKFAATNIYTGGPMTFIMDPKHNIKKIQNNIEKSNEWQAKISSDPWKGDHMDSVQKYF